MKSLPERSLNGIVFNIQRYSIHDGPGIRTIVFLKGCPLRCLWCSNPESQSASPQLLIDWTHCIGCKHCVDVCPTGAAALTDLAAASKVCLNCGLCVKTCPTGARAMAGRVMIVDEVMEEVERDFRFYYRSEGGLTLSGGEPLAQPEFTAGLLKQCYLNGLHSTMESCGLADWEKWKAILPYLDLVLYDLKHMDSDKHKEYTGVGNELILENARKIAQAGKEIIFRVPVIPGYNDSLENLQATVDFASALGTVEKIQFLPYHQLGQNKYDSLGRPYPLSGLPSLDYDTLISKVNRINSMKISLIIKEHP